ncbi:glycosyl hydrolase family 28-related protein, partial [Azotobacter armeniacus]
MDYNIKDFGAMGDGATDDTAAIQAAIDAAHASGGGTVYLPAGEYRISGGGEPSDGGLTIKSNVYLAGAGMGETVIKMVDGWGQDVTGMVRSAYGEETSNFGMRDLTLDGNRDNTTGKVDGWFNGYIPGQNGADRDVTLERVEVREMSGYGFDPHEQTINLVLRDSIAHDNGLDGFVADYQINGVFENNVSYNNDRHGFNVVTSTHDFTLTNNVAYGNGGVGLVVQRGSYDVSHPYNILIDGGAYYDNALEGVQIKMSDNVTLQDADIYGNGTYGVRVYGAQDVQLLDNRIHDNTQSGAYPEVLLQSYDDTAGVSGNYYATTGTWIEGNVITGSANATHGVQERNDGTDYNSLYANTISGGQISPVRLYGANSTVSGSSSGQTPEGTDGNDVLIGTDAGETLIGRGGNDSLDGAGGDDILIGGAGRDTLTGGAGADVFRFEARSDSQRNYATGDNQADRITDFTPGEDRIDVSALGFTGLGNGYNGTLAVAVNAAGDRTDLKNYETDANGYSFEVSLAGNYQGLLTAEHFIFASPQRQVTIEGTEANDTLVGTEADELILGLAGNDSLSGEGGNDVLDGGAGVDTLRGGEGADVFRFSGRADSYRTDTISASDLILDFDASQDSIDLTSLGFSGFGDGYNGTLLLQVNAEGTRTYLKSLEANAEGQHFEIALDGNFSGQLDTSNVLFEPSVFNARDFGALGDGVSDDRAAIQAAIDAAHAAGGGTVYLPAGEYRVSGGREPGDGCLMLKDNVYLAGTGMGQTVIKLVDGWDQKVTGMIRSAYGEETSNFGMRDLTLDGNRANNIEKVDGWFNGYIPGQAGTDRNVTIERVEVREMSGYGFDPHEQTINLVLRDSIAHDNGFDGFVADYQINGVFENNVAYNNGRHGFNVVTSTHDFTMTNNVAYGNGGAGLVIQRGAEDLAHPYNILIDGGAYYDNALEGVLFKMTNNVTLQNAEIHGNGNSGVRLYGTDDVRIFDNQIHDNSQNGSYPEVLLQAFDDSQITGNVYQTLNTWIEGNAITASANATYGVQERNDGSDYTSLQDNSISGGQIASVRLYGANSTVTGASGEPPQGTDGNDVLIGSDDDELILGGAGDDRLFGNGGDDVLDGGAGRDRLTGGEGADTFYFALREDSHRSPLGTFNDLILDFDPTQDRIDVSALGFTGLGNGYGGTLAVTTSADGTRTYLKSYEADAEGRTFELSLDGNHAGTLSASNIVFGAPLPVDPNVEGAPVVGTEGDDQLHGTGASELISGGGGDDHLYGYAGNDVLDGGAGRDKLTGGEGADTFRFSLREDSHRSPMGTFSDQILDFDPNQDRIDVSALGFSGLGNGYNGTLAV